MPSPKRENTLLSCKVAKVILLLAVCCVSTLPLINAQCHIHIVTPRTILMCLRNQATPWCEASFVRKMRQRVFVMTALTGK